MGRERERVRYRTCPRFGVDCVCDFRAGCACLASGTRLHVYVEHLYVYVESRSGLNSIPLVISRGPESLATMPSVRICACRRALRVQYAGMTDYPREYFPHSCGWRDCCHCRVVASSLSDL